MKTHVTGHPVLSELRHALAAVIFGNPLFLPEEQLLANHRIHEWENKLQLARWLTTLPTVLAKRQRANSILIVSSAGHVV
jgi:hypothetical protein